MVSCEIVVSGKVQGVGFRRFVLDQARLYNISGFVKNRFTREVYIIASGQEMDIKLFIDKVGQGNLFSRVEKIDFFKIPTENKYEGFYIR